MKNIVHPWHGVGVGKDAPKVVNMIVEIPKDGKLKYELDKESGLLKMDRFMYSAMSYPGDYGFIPQTLWEDGDALDIFVLTNIHGVPLAISEVKVIGLIRMEDDEERDDKIISVHANDPRFKEWNDIRNIPQHYLRNYSIFLRHKKNCKGRRLKFMRS